ncbi:NAD(P)-dependent oxidoreductase [Marinobacter litoralis]|nr:NAD(P)-dependent oxidoreductase [Marinobacter litoralis]
MRSLKDKTIIITGASRGIGREVARVCATEGANVVIAAKSDQPHPTLEGTIHSVAKEVQEAGGQSLAVKVDVRSEEDVDNLIAQTAETFGGIDAIINNAGAIALSGVESTPLKKLDLMMQINFRAVFLLSQKALPHLKKSENGHILSFSPPLDLDRRWMRNHAPYTLTKYGMSMLTLGMSDEFKRYGIAVNALWPRTVIHTAATAFGGKQSFDRSRTPKIMADAAFALLKTENREITGQLLIDEDFLRTQGVEDFEQYRANPASNKPDLMPDLFVQAPDAYAHNAVPPLAGFSGEE